MKIILVLLFAIVVLTFNFCSLRLITVNMGKNGRVLFSP